MKIMADNWIEILNDRSQITGLIIITRFLLHDSEYVTAIHVPTVRNHCQVSSDDYCNSDGSNQNCTRFL